jgi:hypothetical protein
LVADGRNAVTVPNPGVRRVLCVSTRTPSSNCSAATARGDQVPAAQQELPDQVDTDSQQDRSLLERFGLDLSDLPGLLSKLPSSVTDKLPAGIGKLLGN